ncbi:MAG: hypothetical protein K2M06_08095 [Muribaculaceae bacterium]|nr:hypothetical protein [Muribaculaceae bacterium]
MIEPIKKEDLQTAPRPRAVVLMEGREYLRPYLERVFEPEYEFLICRELPAGEPVDACVSILGEDDRDEGLAMPAIIIPEVIATGMDGLGRRLAEDVAAGRFFAIRDTDYPRVRVVHATDVAEAAFLAAKRGAAGIWRLDDGAEPTLNELADALAYRMNGKRLYALPRKWARLFGVGRKWMRYSCSPAPEVASFAEAFDFRPTPVCTYLKTHVYDGNSL